MQDRVFVTINQEILMEKLASAEYRVCYAAPGIHTWVARAIIESSSKIEPKKIKIITDANPFVMQVGYGTAEALQLLQEASIPVRTEAGLRIGVVIVDDFAAVFGPQAHNIEEFKTDSIPNAVQLSSDEAARLLNALNPDEDDENEDDDDENEVREPEIGSETITPVQLDKIHAYLEEHPPAKPDLERQMRVINSTFQIVKIAFKGANLAQRKVQLKSASIGITDPELTRRIAANFKVFDSDVGYLTSSLKHNLDSIKKRHDLKPLGDIGHLFLSRDKSALEESLKCFQAEVDKAKVSLDKMVARELEIGKKRPGDLLRPSLSREFEDDVIELKLNAIIGHMGFPKVKDVLSNIELEWNIFHVSEQMINKPEFAAKVEEFYDRPIEELAQIEFAVGVRGSGAPGSRPSVGR